MKKIEMPKPLEDLAEQGIGIIVRGESAYTVKTFIVAEVQRYPAIAAPDFIIAPVEEGTIGFKYVPEGVKRSKIERILDRGDEEIYIDLGDKGRFVICQTNKRFTDHYSGDSAYKKPKKVKISHYVTHFYGKPYL